MRLQDLPAGSRASAEGHPDIEKGHVGMLAAVEGDRFVGVLGGPDEGQRLVVVDEVGQAVPEGPEVGQLGTVADVDERWRVGTIGPVLHDGGECT